METERNGLITFASLKAHKERLVDEERENLEPQPECCIYRVPKAIRKLNEEAYTPQVISIGPLHQGKEELAYMEKQKIRYRREFCKRRITPETWQEFVTFIQNHEQRIRNCYEETSKLEKLEFITMILYDAVFIIELFLRYYERVRKIRTALPYNPLSCVYIQLDLVLLENQLPYFVLEKLYMIAFPGNIDYPSFFSLSCAFLQNISIRNDKPISLGHADVQLKHFTDLNRYLMTMRFSRLQDEGSIFEMPCAVKLQESGVRFKLVERESFLNITLEKKRLLSLMPWFKVQELQIPAITIDDAAEPLLRNLMALEQCHYPSETYICNYIYLMDYLINAEEDVNLLVEAGIICNHVGDNAKVADMFNKFCKHIMVDRLGYCDIFKDLKAHYDNPWNHAVSTLKLKRVYFNSLWRGTGTVAAIVLLVLTLVQTICSIRQFV